MNRPFIYIYKKMLSTALFERAHGCLQFPECSEDPQHDTTKSRSVPVSKCMQVSTLSSPQHGFRGETSSKDTNCCYFCTLLAAQTPFPLLPTTRYKISYRNKTTKDSSVNSMFQVYNWQVKLASYIVKLNKLMVSSASRQTVFECVSVMIAYCFFVCFFCVFWSKQMGHLTMTALCKTLAQRRFVS